MAVLLAAEHGLVLTVPFSDQEMAARMSETRRDPGWAVHRSLFGMFCTNPCLLGALAGLQPLLVLG